MLKLKKSPIESFSPVHVLVRLHVIKHFDFTKKFSQLEDTENWISSAPLISSIINLRSEYALPFDW